MAADIPHRLPAPPPTGTRTGSGSTLTALAFLLLGFVPIVGLAGYACYLARASMDRLVQNHNLSAALITRELVERNFRERIEMLETAIRTPIFRAAIRARDEEAVRAFLGAMVEAHDSVDRAFVTDLEGTLWSDFPLAPESLGKNFSYRDWYRGVTADWKPHVSPVYRRHARPQLLLVAIATPIRDGDEVLGLIVCQVRLECFARLVRRAELGQEGQMILLDSTGTVAAHPHLDLQARIHREYARSAPVRSLLSAGVGTLEYTDPRSGRPMLVTALPCPIQGDPWIVLAQQSRGEATRPGRILTLQISGAGLMMAMIAAWLSLGLARYHVRVAQLNRGLAGTNLRLEEENAQRRRAEAALQESHDELERRVEAKSRDLRLKEEQLLQARKMEAVGRLAGSVAHDFNNFLSIINGYSELVVEKMAGDDPLRSEVQQILKAGDRAGEMTRQLLAFSRKTVLKPRVLDVNQVIRTMASMLDRLVGEGVELETRLAPDLRPVAFDPGQLERVLINLAVNARDAMPGGGRLLVATSNVELDQAHAERHPDARPGPHVRIEIADEGQGMDEETRSRIFEPFFTTKELGRGTGLGLSTVYGIVRQSGGQIELDSEPGRGTLFRIHLPPAAPDPTLPEAPDEAARPAGGDETILVVEDQPEVRLLIRTILEGSGYRVLEAGDAAGALRLCREAGPIQLLLADVYLPKTLGPDLARQVLVIRPGVEVVFMSGYTGESVVARGLLEPGRAFLEKPFSPRALLEKVRAALVGPGDPPGEPVPGPGIPAAGKNS